MSKKNTRLINRPIKLKIIAILFISVLVWVISLFILGNWQHNKNLVQQKSETGKLAAQVNEFINTANSISHHIAQNKYVVERLNGNPHLSESEADNHDLSITLYSTQLISRAAIVYIMNSEGLVIASTTYDGDKTLTGNQYAFRPYFQEAISGKNSIYAAVGVTTLERGLYFSAPVFQANTGKHIGVVVIKMGLDTIDQVFIHHHSIAGIMSPDGIVFSTNKPDWFFKTAMPLSETQRSLLVKSRQFANQPLQSLPVTLDKKIIHINNQTYGVVIKDIAVPGWMIFTVHAIKSPYPYHLASISFLVIAFVTFLIILNLLSNYMKSQLESDKKRAEEEILTQKNFLETVLNSLAYPFYIINIKDYTVALANKASGIAGMSGKITCYKASHNLDSPCQKKDTICAVEELKSSKKPIVLEQNEDENGIKKVIEVHAHPIFDSNGHMVQIIKYMVDITHRKKMEEELLKRRQIESIGILAGGIAHDFNNLLSVIIGNITMVKDELLPGENHYLYLSNAEKAVIKAADLAKKLTTFSRSGWLERESLLLPDIIQQTIADMPSHLHTNFYIDIQKNLPPFIGDKRQMIQVFSNICQNAAEADPEKKGITITAENILNPAAEMSTIADPTELENLSFIHITISDKGKGIPKKDLGAVFNPYFSTKPKGEQKGMGLGLTVCYSIITKHKGYISIQSEEGKGTTVNIFLPIDYPKTPTQG